MSNKKIREIIEIIEEKRDRALKEWEIDNKIRHSAYGTGVEWGEYNMCVMLLEEIK